jgi:O-antigen/teichoic acid export membrane protein
VRFHISITIMKAIWTLIFLAIIATTFGLALLFIAEPGRTDRFWLSIGALGMAELFLWVAFTFRGTARGEQAGGFAKLSIIVATVIYFFIAAALALLALTGLSFKMLLALHILALLGFVIFAGLAAIGTRVLQGTNEAQRPR